MSRKTNGTTKNAENENGPTEVHSRIRETPIAIVGMASLMPDAKALDRYWSNITERVNSIVDVPASRWAIDDYYDADPAVPDKTYCKRGAFLPEIEFNPMEYGLPPNILDVTDAGQLLSLVVAKDVLEDAEIYEDSNCDRDRIGCVLGIGGGQKLSSSLTARLQYPVIERILRSSGVPEVEIAKVIEKYKANFVPWEENSFPGLLGNVIAGRIANRFDLGGMNSVVDAACASSLSAIKVACSELLEGHSDMMITGGACTDNSIFMYMSFSKTPAFTQDEFIKPFDSESKGMMIGEGIGMIALKRLPDAVRDGDRIYATINGIGSSSDGKFKSIYAPRPQGQAKALRRAYADAGYAPSTVGLLEAHGTGTAAGDVAEFGALMEVFAESSTRTQHIALGSVKSQIGHLKAAAGIAGLIKSALALHHKVIPATLSVKKPNPKLGLEQSPFYINTETRPWTRPADGSPRRAGVSAFGFGGTNFHVTMQEHSPAQEGAYRLNMVGQPCLLAAANRTQLASACRDALSALETGDPLTGLGNFQKSMALREIPADYPRLGFVSTTRDETITLLRDALAGLEKNAGVASWDTPAGVYFRSEAFAGKGTVVALFSGQGSQYVGMGAALACNFPAYLDSVNKMDQLYSENGQDRLSDKVFPIPVFDAASHKANETTLQQTQAAQPGIGTFSAGVYKLFTAAGFKPDFVAGHSFGELTALWAAGVYGEEDFYRLAKARGEAMAVPDDPNFDAGTMAAIVGEVSSLADDLKDFPDVRIANFNSKTQVVIAGPKEVIAAASTHLKEKGYKAIALPVSAAFHTPLVGHAQAPFAQAIDAVTFSEPTIPVYSNSTGAAYETTVEAIRTTLKNHILNSVHFVDELENIHAAGGRIFVEFGPKKVLAPMVASVLADKEHVAISINPNPKNDSDIQLRAAAVQLAVAGITLSELDPHSVEKRVYNTEKKSPLKIKLTASNYLSDKFIEKRDAILNDGFTLSSATPEVVIEERIVPEPSRSNGSQPSYTPPAVVTPMSADGLEESLALFYAHERETLKIHERYLETPKQYSETFHALMDKQMDVLSNRPDAALPDGVERTLLSFHENHNETLKIHEKFLDQQAETTRSTLNLLREHHSILTGSPRPKPTFPIATDLPTATIPTPPAPIVQAAPSPTPIPSPSAPAITPAAKTTPALDSEQLKSTMLQVVAEKTGYPTDMLELDMDMEADLGIDSIKRVEILGAVQEAHPGLPELNPEVMSELRTLGEIVDYMEGQIAVVVESSSPLAPLSTSTPETDGLNAERIKETMLSVVSEKTGYPTDMLELGMDMEADLGIDSIKRVEILGAVQEECPELPEVKAETLAEQRTLDDIIQCFLETSSVASASNSLITVVDNLEVHSTTSRSIAHLEFVAAPDQLLQPVPESRCCVLTDDGTALTIQLAEALLEQGWKVAVLSYPKELATASGKMNESITRIALEDTDEATLVHALAAITKKSGKPARFVHLDPECKSDADAKAVLKITFLIAKHLSDALNDAPADARCGFISVAHLDGQLGFGGGGFRAIAGGLFGLTKTLNLEWPEVFCRAIDIAPGLDTPKAVDAILSECSDPNLRVVEVGFGPEGRCTLVPSLEQEDGEMHTDAIDDDSVFLVSGGAKGVTAECIVKLAACNGGTYILIGRSSLTPVPQWAEELEDEASLKLAGLEQLKSSGEKPIPVKVQALLNPIQSTRSIESVLARIDAAGGCAHYVSADVADADALRNAIEAVVAKTGAVTGIIHGAGVLADNVIEKKTPENFDWVYGPKVEGFDALIACVKPEELKHLCVFSSAAGFFGNPAQSDYSIANEILNKHALVFKAAYPACHVTSFNWGPWDGGMVTPALKKLFASRNIQVIPIEEGTDIFVNDLTDMKNSAIQILVGSSMEFNGGGTSGELHTYQITRHISVHQNPFLSDHCIDGKPVLPMAGVMSWMGSSCEALLPDYRFFSTDNMKMLKGIVFQSGNIVRYHLEITETEKDTDHVSLDLVLWSDATGDRVNHYGATVTLVKGQPEIPIYDHFDPADANAVDGADYYQNGTLFHGPLFQVIDRGLNASTEKLTLLCTASGPTISEQGQFPIGTQHLYATDAKFQALLVWARQFKEAGALPTRFARCEQYREIPAGETFFLSLDITAATNTRVNGTITLHDVGGHVYSRLIDAETTISKNLNIAAAVN